VSIPQAPYIIPAENALSVFTDGASLPGPRRGGVGIHFVHNDSVGNEAVFDLEEPGYAGATNNRMELQAVIVAVKAIQSGRVPAEMLEGIRKIDIYSDSQYVVDHLPSAIYDWPGNRWMKRAGGPVLNADLWQELTREYKKLKRTTHVELKWGKGHSSSNPHNQAADKLAKASARRPTRTLGVPSVVRRKKSSRSTEVGSVEMGGQRLTIRIISVDYLKEQGLSRYRYEVLSRGSQFRGCIDFAYSSDPTLRPAHTYHVTMNDDSAFPQIAKCHREIVPKVKN